MEEHCYLYQLRSRVDHSLPNAEDEETLEPWARLPAQGFQSHEVARMDIWPSDSYNIASRILATASIFAILALSSYKGVFSFSVTEYRKPNLPRAFLSTYEALGPNGSSALLYKDFLSDGSDGDFQCRILTYFWFDRSVFTAEILDVFTVMKQAPQEGPLQLAGMLREWIWSRCNMNDTQFWCLGTEEQMLFGWCDWDSNTIYTTKRFACDEPAPTLLEMTIYWIVEAFTEHPDLASWHTFSGSTGVKARCKQGPNSAGWTRTPHINTSGGTVTSTTCLGSVGNISLGASNSNAVDSNGTLPSHSHVLVTNVNASNAIARGSGGHATPLASHKRRLEEEGEADNEKHHYQRRNLTHLFEWDSDDSCPDA